MSEQFIKQFPPPEDMLPNVLVIVKLPSKIYDECIDFLPVAQHAIFSIAEQELNIISPEQVKVSVLMERCEDE